MSYDKNGLGFAELSYLALYFPEVFNTLEKALEDNQETIALEIARKTIQAYKLNLI